MTRKFHKTSGFTLVEMIIYIVIFTMILLAIVRLFWQSQVSEVKGRYSREITENAARVVDVFKYYVRSADGVDPFQFVFDTDPGVLILVRNGTVLFDTYTKNVVIGGKSTDIRKLRLTENGESADLTSDHVNVDNFVLSSLAQGDAPDSLELYLTLSSANPGQDPLYDYELDVRTNVSVRKEI
ncbi:type II secretion system protein [Candidatus Peregrinibacteria bacterium]|nr:type II secretion system protein [Candidatus Peregrinibacteria bacterium]